MGVADPGIRTPYVFNWNLNVQQDVWGKGVLQVGYVGSAGRKLFRYRDINQPSVADILAYDYSDSGCCVPRPFDNAAPLNGAIAPSTP